MRENKYARKLIRAKISTNKVVIKLSLEGSKVASSFLGVVIVNMFCPPYNKEMNPNLIIVETIDAATT